MWDIILSSPNHHNLFSYCGICIKRSLKCVVWQSWWSFIAGIINIIVIKTKPEKWYLCVCGKTFLVALNRIHCAHNGHPIACLSQTSYGVFIVSKTVISVLPIPLLCSSEYRVISESVLSVSAKLSSVMSLILANKVDVLHDFIMKWTIPYQTFLEWHQQNDLIQWSFYEAVLRVSCSEMFSIWWFT